MTEQTPDPTPEQTPDDLQRSLVRDVAAYEVDPPPPARVEDPDDAS